MAKIIPNNAQGIEELKRILSATGAQKIDNSQLFYDDIITIRYPKYYKATLTNVQKNTLLKKIFGKNPADTGFWVYYSWLNEVHWSPPENIYHELLTARNLGLVSKAEQKKFYNFNVGAVGLSIGSSAVATIVRGGGGRRIKVADFDNVEPTNLNRLRSGLPSIGLKKAEAISRIAYETNPFIDIVRYDEGINSGNVNSFFDEHFKLDVVIDACDSFDAKMMLREGAKKRKIPVIMVTDLGDGTLFDIERYDIKRNLKPFHNRLANVKGENFMERGLLAIGKENIRPRVWRAIGEIGKTIPTHPQLGNSAYMSGIVISYVVRSLANKQKITDKQVLIDLDDFLLKK